MSLAFVGRSVCHPPSPATPNAGCGTGRKMSGHLKQQPQRIKREIPHQSLLLIPENVPDAFGSWLCGSGCWLTIFSFAMEVHSSFSTNNCRLCCVQTSLCECIHKELGFSFSWHAVLVVISFCLSSRNAKILHGKRWQLTKLLSLTF